MPARATDCNDTTPVQLAAIDNAQLLRGGR